MLTSIIMIPWSIKFLWGVMSDNVPIRGSRRRSYIVINAFISFLALMMLWPRGFVVDKYFITGLLFVSSLNTAFNNVVVDALLVSEARKDKRGSEYLQSYSWMVLSVGAAMGSIGAAFLTEYFYVRNAFLICAIIHLSLCLAGYNLNKSLEKQSDIDSVNKSTLGAAL